jgi:predicted ATPase
MRIESLRLKNFKGFRDVTLKKIPPLCVVVGANGTGKSTLLDVFRFLQDCLNSNVKKALQSRGGFREVLSRGVDSTESISIEIHFHPEVQKKNELVTYLIEIGEEKGKITARREVLKYKQNARSAPINFIDLKCGKGIILDKQGFFKREDIQYKNIEHGNIAVAPDHLALQAVGQFPTLKIFYNFSSLIKKWHLSDFHIQEARGSKETIGADDHLSSSGDNLQRVARYLYDHHREVFEKIIQRMKHSVPDISNIIPQLTEDKRLFLQFQEAAFKDPFFDYSISDGTLKMFAYLVLLYDPEPHPLLCVEEPENQLYPRLLHELAEEFRAYTHSGGNRQVFVATHSSDFLNALRVDEVIWLVKKEGYTTIQKTADDEQLRIYMAEGDQMGYLWEQGFFHGVDPR